MAVTRVPRPTPGSLAYCVGQGSITENGIHSTQFEQKGTCYNAWNVSQISRAEETKSQLSFQEWLPKPHYRLRMTREPLPATCPPNPESGGCGIRKLLAYGKATMATAQLQNHAPATVYPALINAYTVVSTYLQGKCFRCLTPRIVPNPINIMYKYYTYILIMKFINEASKTFNNNQ